MQESYRERARRMRDTKEINDRYIQNQSKAEDNIIQSNINKSKATPSKINIGGPGKTATSDVVNDQDILPNIKNKKYTDVLNNEQKVVDKMKSPYMPDVKEEEKVKKIIGNNSSPFSALKKSLMRSVGADTAMNLWDKAVNGDPMGAVKDAAHMGSKSLVNRGLDLATKANPIAFTAKELLEPSDLGGDDEAMIAQAKKEEAQNKIKAYQALSQKLAGRY